MNSTKVRTFVFLFFVALAVRTATVLFTDFDGLYGQDAFAYYENAKIIHNAFPDLEAIRRDYWPVGKAAPIGYSAVVALGFTGVGISPLAGQIVSLLAGSMVCPLLFLVTVALLANSEWSEKEKLLSGILAGLLGAFSGALVRSSIVVMPDALGLFLATLSVWLALKYTESQRLFLIVLTGSSVGLAILVRSPNALIALAISVYILLRGLTNRKTRLPHLVIGSGLALVMIMPQLLIAFADRPAMISESAMAGWNPLNPFRSSFVTANGSQSHLLPNFLFYLAPVVHPAYLSPLALPAVILGAFQLLTPSLRNGAILLGAWLVFYYVVLVGIPFQNFRYTEPYFPPLAILTSIGFVRLLRSRSVKMAVLITWIGVTLGGMGMFGSRHIGKFLERKGIELQVAQWVDREASNFTNVLAFAVTASIRHYSGVDVKELYYQDTTSLQTVFRSGRTLLVADFSNIDTQWKSTKVFDIVQWIREHYSMQVAGDVPPYRGYVVTEKS